MKLLSLQKGLRRGNVESSISPYTKTIGLFGIARIELHLAFRDCRPQWNFLRICDALAERFRSEPLDSNRSVTGSRPACTIPATPIMTADLSQRYPEQYENVGFVHSCWTVRLLIDFGLLPAPNGSGREVADAVDWCRRQTEHMARLAIQALILGTRNAKTELDIRSDSFKPAGESSGQGIPSFRQNAWARKNYSTPSTRPKSPCSLSSGRFFGSQW